MEKEGLARAIAFLNSKQMAICELLCSSDRQTSTDEQVGQGHPTKHQALL